MDTLSKRESKTPVVGAYGYIKQKRTAYLKKAALFAGIGIAVFILGLLLNKFNKANIFTILAVLFALPMSKAIVSFLIFARYKPAEKSKYESVYEVLNQNLSSCEALPAVMNETAVVKDQVSLYTDVIFTSEEKVMNLDFAVLTNRGLYACLGKEGQDEAYITKYLKDVMKSYHVSCEVKVTNRFDHYLSMVKSGIAKLEQNDTTNEKVINTLNTFIVQ